MRLELVKRGQASRVMMLASPLIAVALTVATAGIIFAVLGHSPVEGLYSFFIEPLTEGWSIEELLVKATPLTIIALGLTVAYLSNNWNIGAEGQFTFGAICGAIVPVLEPGVQGFWLLPLVLIMGFLGGALYAMIPALLKVRFGTNEILTSLMLVYVANLFLDWLVRGIWRDPNGHNFPNTVPFSESAIMPLLGESRLTYAAFVALLLVIAMVIGLGYSLKGFEIRVLGASPRAGGFAGFSSQRMTLFVFFVSGGLAGLAGIMEVGSSIGYLQPVISPGYGFAAIIVAFLGRLNPVGVLIAALVLALSYLGGEAIQVSLKVSSKVAGLLQGTLLFYVLACDALILYRVRLIFPKHKEAAV